MAQTVKVPDPVYSRIVSTAEREDVSHGTIVREWMEKAQRFDELESRYK